MLSQQHASLAAKYTGTAASLRLSPYSKFYGIPTAIDPACNARKLIQASSVGHDTVPKIRHLFSTFSNRRIEKVNIDQPLESTIETLEKGSSPRESSADVQQTRKWQEIHWGCVLPDNSGTVFFLIGLGCVIVGGWILWEKFGRRVNKIIEMLEKTKKAKEAVTESLTRRANRVSQFLERSSNYVKETVKESLAKPVKRLGGSLKRNSKDTKEAVKESLAKPTKRIRRFLKRNSKDPKD
ncbi:hypothetical protein XPA_004519 [Xanthoria parietina]